ncbi:MAG: hypothetical protein HY736_26105 [Verrucomicrobia bacterium]|nr:hypothetical protein [Verrucomicrobiota bacterium]
MKRILVPGVREEVEYLCDVSGKPAVASLTLKFGYPSDHDGQMLEADLGNEVANDILALLQSKYPQLKLVDYFP